MMRNVIIIALALALSLSGCGQKESITDKYEASGFTLIVEVIPGSTDPGKCSGLSRDAGREFERIINNILGENGELAKLNTQRGTQKVSDEFYAILGEAIKYHDITRNNWTYRFGRVYDLYRNTDVSIKPNSEELDKELNSAYETRIELSDGNNVLIEGDGMLRLSWFVAGYAMDQATRILKEGGVQSGMLTCGILSSFWGQRSKDASWEFIIPAGEDKTYDYKISPDAGSMCLINIALHEGNPEDNKKILVLDPETGHPVESLLYAAAWGSTPYAALTYAEAIHVMGRKDGLLWASAENDIGAFVVYSDIDETFVESDPTMSPWVEMHIP